MTIRFYYNHINPHCRKVFREITKSKSIALKPFFQKLIDNHGGIIILVINSESEGTLHDLLLQEFDNATDIDICVSFIRSSGLSLLIEKIREALQKNCRIRIITSTYLYITQPCALRALLQEQDHYPQLVSVKIYPFEIEPNSYLDSGRRKTRLQSFHPKGYIFRTRTPKDPMIEQHSPALASTPLSLPNDNIESAGKVIIGSANLTKSGIKSGIEWSIMEDRPALIHDTLKEFNHLWHAMVLIPLSLGFLERYTKNYQDYHISIRSKSNSPSTPVLSPSSSGKIEDSEIIRPTSQTSQISQQITPNTIQTEALTQLQALHDHHKRAAAIIAATGLGKTFLAAFDVRQFQARTLLFIAHRTDLIKQSTQKFRMILPEMRGNTIQLIEGATPEQARYVFASVQSLTSSNEYMSHYPPDFFDYIVIDEFHHSVAASYQKVLQYFRPQFVLGLTATPERPDGKDVIEVCDNNIAYRKDLYEAINDQFLVPFHYFGVAEDSHVDYADFNWRQLHDVTTLEDKIFKRRLDYIIEKIDEYGFDGIKRKCLGYCISITHAKYMAAQFCDRFGTDVAVSLTSEDDLDRARIFRRLEDLTDPLQYIFSVNILNEGIDIPSVNTVLFLRPTLSSIVFLQQLGRGLRLHPERDFLTVLDFVGNKEALALSMEAVHDPSKGRFDLTLAEVKPPEGCEVLLEDQTQEILESLRRRLTYKEQMLLQLKEMAQELEDYPTVLDLLAFKDAPTLWEIRSRCGSFLAAIAELHEIQVLAAPSTDQVSHTALNLPAPFLAFLDVFEKNWQEKRIEAFAYVYGLLHHYHEDAAFDYFYQQFPEWKVEERSADRIKLYARLERKMRWQSDGETRIYFDKTTLDFTPNAQKLLGDSTYGDHLKNFILERLHYMNRYYYRERHQGVLRLPVDLLLGHYYSRPEIVNYFHRQFDPQKHERGILSFNLKKNAPEIATHRDDSLVIAPRYHVLLVNYHKSRKHRERGHDYQDQFLSKSTFQWQTPSRWTQTTSRTQSLIHQSENQHEVHLFIQEQSGEPYVYCGTLHYRSHRGSAPVTFLWEMDSPLSTTLREKLKLKDF